MAKEKEAVRQATPLEAVTALVTTVQADVLHGRTDMPAARLIIQNAFAGFTADERRELLQTAKPFFERVRQVAEAIVQEFQTVQP